MGKLYGFKEYKRETADKRPVKVRIKDFNELYNAFPEDKLRNQGARCMNCGIPFCSWGCSIGNLMPDWNDMVFKGEWEKAYERLCLTNNFPEFTGRICPALCEGACTLGVNREAVSIKEIELDIIEKAFKEGWVKPNLPKVRTGKNVAVIGSGPSGLAAAAELNSVGHNVTVFERDNEIGGLLRYGIPNFKLEKSIVNRRVEIMKAEGVQFKINTNVGFDFTKEELMDNFDSVILTGGSTVARDLSIEGRELKGIHFAMEFLSQANKRIIGEEITDVEISAKDKIVLVIGGGDTGSDCIGTSIRQGAAKVYQYEILPKPPLDRDATMPWPNFPRTLKTTTSHEEGCIRGWNIGSKRFIGLDGKVTDYEGIQLEWKTDANGRMNMVELPGTEFTHPVDLVLLAMGFLHPQHEGILEQLDVKLDGRGNVVTDGNFMTDKDGIFAAGDMRRGQSLVVWAINEGRIVAKNVDKYLMGETALRG
ncbi:MAG TPA: glutamate synthase subunit beta [Clostridiaceae bacterium]